MRSQYVANINENGDIQYEISNLDKVLIPDDVADDFKETHLIQINTLHVFKPSTINLGLIVGLALGVGVVLIIILLYRNMLLKKK